MAEVVTSENSAEFYAQRLRLAPEPAEAAVEAEPVLESVKDTNGAHAEAEAGEQQTSDPQEGKQRINKRFSDLTKERDDAKAEAEKRVTEAKTEREARERAERRASELQAKYEPPKPDNLGPEPKLEQFENPSEWKDAWKDWTAETLKRETAQKETAARVERSWSERVQAQKADLADYDAVIAAGANLVISNEVRDAILDSDVGPKIHYHLAKNPELVAELADMKLQPAMRLIGKLEAKFEAGKPKTEAGKEPPKPVVAATEISRAPAPIQPLKTVTAAAEPLVDSSGEYHGTFAQYKEARKAGKIK